MKTNWQSIMPTNGEKEPMPQNIGHYIKLAAMDLELMMEQKAEIGKLKQKLNKLQQKSLKGLYVPVRKQVKH